MNGNEATLQAYLYENRISPTAAFSARIDAACEQIRRRESADSGSRADRTRGERTRRPAARRALVAAACVLAAAVITVAAIPSARAAVEDWLNDLFSISGYFQKDREDREEEPTIEAIITDAGQNSAVITSVGEGFEEYAAGFGMTLDEIAYDGSTIFLTGTMTGQAARPFVQVYTGGDTFRVGKNDGSLGGDPSAEYYYFECESSVALETAEGGVYYGDICPSMTPEMDELIAKVAGEDPDIRFENGELVTSNAQADELWDEYLADHDVRFFVELYPAYIDTPELTGMVNGELTLRLFYGNIEGQPATPVLDADLGDITIDADAYKTQTTQAAVGASVQLGGVHPMTMMEWQPVSERTSNDCEVYLYTHELDFTGASVALKEITFTPTDTELLLHVVLPESWTGAERAYCNLTFDFLLDGDAADGLFGVCGPTGTNDETGEALEYDCKFFSSTLSPSQWAAAKTLTIIPATVYWWDMTARYDGGQDETVSLRDGNVYTCIVNHTSWQNDELYDVMPQYAITIDLDDYR